MSKSIKIRNPKPKVKPEPEPEINTNPNTSHYPCLHCSHSTFFAITIETRGSRSLMIGFGSDREKVEAAARERMEQIGIVTGMTYRVFGMEDPGLAVNLQSWAAQCGTPAGDIQIAVIAIMDTVMRVWVDDWKVRVRAN